MKEKKALYPTNDPLKELQERVWRDEKFVRDICGVIETVIDTLESGKLDLFQSKIFARELTKKLRW